MPTSHSISWLMQEGMQILPIISRIQSNGMPVSISRISSLKSEMQSELDALSLKIYNEHWGSSPVRTLEDIPKSEEFNPKSPKQVAALCRRLGLRPSQRTKTGAASTSEKSIGEFRFTSPAIQAIFDWRQRQHNRDTYCNDVLSRIPPGYTEDLFTIRANWGPTKVPTRRQTTRDPNILGIPTRTELGRKVRDCYIAPPGMIWCGYDLSGIEVRCLAHLSRDPLWVHAFREGISPHKDTAMRLFRLNSLKEVSDLQKAIAKTINFLIIYGGGAANLYDQFRTNNIQGYDLPACRQLIRDWYSTYSGVTEYRERVISEARRTERSIDHWGMARDLPGINCDDPEIRSEEGRITISQKVQGLATGAIRNSLVWMYPKLEMLAKAGLLHPQFLRNFIHDELVFLVRKGEEENLTEIVMEGLTRHLGVELIVPVEAESHYGETWGELK